MNDADPISLREDLSRVGSDSHLRAVTFAKCKRALAVAAMEPRRVRRRGNFTHMLCLVLVTLLTAQTPASSVVFEHGHETAPIPFELNSNKIYLQVKVEGKGPFNFVLDSGAPRTFVDMGLGKRLGLQEGAVGKTGGAGAGQRDIARTQFREIFLPGLRFHPANPSLLDLDPALAPVEGRHLFGLLGGDLLSKTVVEVDYAKSTVTFHDPATYKHRGEGCVVPLKVQGWMFANATLRTGEGQELEGAFLIDIGDRLALTLNTPFVNEHHLLTSAMPRWPVGSGIGGLITHGIARFASLKMGNGTFIRPIATLSQDSAGAFSAGQYQGLIGAELLKHYRLTIDYPHSTLYLDPGGLPPGGEFDCSGMFLEAKGPNLRSYEVLAAAKGSPASEAGIQAGDAIAEVDGRPAASFSLEEIRRRLKQDGAAVSMTVSRGGQIHRATVKLRLPA